MPPASRKRRAPADDEDPTPTLPQRNRQREDTPEEEADVDDVGEQEEGEGEEEDSGSASIAQLSKSLVRYALACERQRMPIKRQDVNQRVLGAYNRQFKQVFDAANSQLMDVFGMLMVELPNKEKVTMRQKRAAAAAAAASESQNKSSNQWILQNILPEQYRSADIIGPAARVAENEPDEEGAYVGIYTMIVALIMASGGRISQSRLDRYMTRMNIKDFTPIGSTEKVFKDMIKQGYVVEVKDTSSGEVATDYMVGPRGKVEIGKEGVANFVRAIVGDSVEDIEQRLARTLEFRDAQEDVLVVNGEAAAPATGPGRRRGRVQRNGDDNDDLYE